MDTHVAGITASIAIYRDPQGIPHVRAASAHDAFFGQGWVHAQDRLFQMEYDRRRAYGRWAEWVGPAGVEGDRLLRRFRLEASARLDWEHASADARAMLEAFAAGVNAFIDSTKSWGVEFEVVGARPLPGSRGTAWPSSRCVTSTWARGRPSCGAPSCSAISGPTRPPTSPASPSPIRS